MSFGFCLPCPSNCCKGSPSPCKSSDGIPPMFKPIRVDSPVSILRLPRRASPEESLNSEMETLKNYSQNIECGLCSEGTSKSSYSISSLYGFEVNDEEDEEFIIPLLPRTVTSSEVEFNCPPSSSSFWSASVSNEKLTPSRSRSSVYVNQVRIAPQTPNPVRPLDFLDLKLKHIDSETSSEVSSLTFRDRRSSSYTHPIVVSSLEQKVLEPTYKTCVNIQILPSESTRNGRHPHPVSPARDENSNSPGKGFLGLRYKGRQSKDDYRICVIKPLPPRRLSDIQNLNKDKLTVDNPPGKNNILNGSCGSDIYFSKTPSPNLSVVSNGTRVSEFVDKVGEKGGVLPAILDVEDRQDIFYPAGVTITENEPPSPWPPTSSCSAESDTHAQSIFNEVTSPPKPIAKLEFPPHENSDDFAEEREFNYVSTPNTMENERTTTAPARVHFSHSHPQYDPELIQTNTTGDPRSRNNNNPDEGRSYESVEIKSQEQQPGSEPTGILQGVEHLNQSSAPLPAEISKLSESVQRIQEYLKNREGIYSDVGEVQNLLSGFLTTMDSPEFKQVLHLYNKIRSTCCIEPLPYPNTTNLHQLTEECAAHLHTATANMRQESCELENLLNGINFENLVNCHDQIADRETGKLPLEASLNFGQSADGVIQLPFWPPSGPSEEEWDRSRNCKIVRVEKTNEPLGVTVRNESDKIIVGRIVTGGTVEKSGLLQEGDEILKINDIQMAGKSVHEICDLLSEVTGILAFCIVPSGYSKRKLAKKDTLVHMRANFNYDPEDDVFVPCRELGIGFRKGDILHVINQDDTNWWQARRDGEEDALAGLIPSKTFQEQRESIKRNLICELEVKELKPSRSSLLCSKPDKKLRKKKISSQSTSFEEIEADEIPTYEEVTLYYPRSALRRPIVLIGPPNIGRHEIRQLLLRDSNRFAAAIPHTSRSPKPGEVEGLDFHFVSRSQFETDILSRKFVEHGEFEKSYYGTSVASVRDVIDANKICILNLYPQSIKSLRNANVKPFVVFISPPSLERLRQIRLLRGESCKEDELFDVIRKGQEMEEKFGHYFDHVIVNSDFERTYLQLLNLINYIESEPQWIPKCWLK